MKLFCIYDSCADYYAAKTGYFTQNECITMIAALSMLKLKRVEEYHKAMEHAFQAGDDPKTVDRQNYKLDLINKLIDKVMQGIIP